MAGALPIPNLGIPMQALPEMYDQIRTLTVENDAPGIRQLVSMGVPPNHPNKAGQTALHLGGLWGNVEAVMALLDCRANVNAQNIMRGAAPLHSAAQGRGPADKRAECVKLLLAAKANPQLEDNNGNWPIDLADDEILRLAFGAAPLILHKAVQAKSSSALADAMNEICTGRTNLALDEQNPDGDTALHCAVVLGWREGVQSLLQARASVIIHNDQQKTLLHSAVLSGCLSNVALLIKARADTNAQDRDMDANARFKSTSFHEDSQSHRSPLHYAAEMGNTLIAGLLLAAKAHPDKTDSKRQTPLHLCIAVLRSEEAMLERGSGVRVQGLLKKPEWNGQLGSIMGDKAPGAPQKAAGYVSVPESGGRWPVMLAEAAQEGVLLKEDNLAQTREEMVDLLIDARADVNAGNNIMGETRTPLHEAARVGDTVLLQKLALAKADLNKQDRKLGMTALHLGARSKHHDVVCILVEARADLLLATVGGKTAADLAETNGASPATLALLRGSEAPAISAVAVANCEVQEGQTLENLTAEQRAMLFLD